MKKKIILFCSVIISILSVCLIYYFSPKVFCKNISNDRGDIFIEIRDGTTGNIVNITEKEDVDDILNLLKKRTYKKSSLSLGYMGTKYTLTIYDGCSKKDSFIINDENLIRKDPFFYTCDTSNNESIMSLLDEKMNKLYFGSEKFINNVYKISYINHSFDKNGEFLADNTIEVTDAQKIQDFFYILLIEDYKKLDDIPENFAKVLASSSSYQPDYYTFNIEMTDGNLYQLMIVKNSFCFNHEYYKTNCNIQYLLDIINGTFVNPYSTYNLNITVKSCDSKSISFNLTNNWDKNIKYDSSYILEYYDPNTDSWYEWDKKESNEIKNTTSFIIPGETQTIDINLCDSYDDLELGQLYRLSKDFQQEGNDKELAVYDIYLRPL